MMKYIFIIPILFLNCKNGKQECNIRDYKTVSFYKNKFSIKLPLSLLNNRDSINYNFDYEKSLIYINHLYSSDSLSTVFVTVHENYLNRKDFTAYAKQIEDNYKKVFTFQNDQYLYEKLDTSGKNNLYRFSFNSNQNNRKVKFGILFYLINNSRIELIIKIDQSNFSETDIDCIFNSLQIND